MKEQEILNAVKEMRISWKENDDKRDSGLPHDIPEVTRIDDLQYGQDSQWNLLDLYLPKNVKGKIPVIINIHGGGWVYGNQLSLQLRKHCFYQDYIHQHEWLPSEYIHLLDQVP